MKDNQILINKDERSIHSMLDRLVHNQKTGKHIPVTVYEEIHSWDKVDDWENKALVITNIGGKLYKKTIIGL